MASQLSRKVLPGQPGTKKLLDKYGDRLVCVRYRYDIENHKRFKTMEIILEENDWFKDTKRIPANKIIDLKIVYGETYLGRLVRAAGGRWNRKKKLWELPYSEAMALGLEDRIVT